jgi:flagellar protein FliO/FliZ
MGQVTLALCIVLGAIFLCAWLARRMRNISSGRAGAVNVVAEVRLGPKERAVLLQVGNTQLLVGVAPGRINALHVLAEPVAAAPTAAAADAVSFKSLLRRSLGK